MYGAILDEFRRVSGNYVLVRELLEERLPERRFWDLEEQLSQPLPKGMHKSSGSSHRWGVLAVVLKLKTLAICFQDPSVGWLQLKVRPLVSYFRHYWAPLLSMTCRVLNAMSKEVYSEGDGVMDVRLIMERLMAWNMADNPANSEAEYVTRRIATADIAAFYNNIERSEVLDAVGDCVATLRARRKHFA